MENNVLVLGYYFKNNWGDDAFEYVFKKYLLLKKYNVTFSDVSDTSKYLNKSYHCIIIGGGDLVNDYFLHDSYLELLDTFYPNTPIFFVSTGITYESCLYKLDIGDYFFMRSKADTTSVLQRHRQHYVKCIPDIVFLLSNETRTTKYSNEIKNIGLILPGPWVNEDNKQIILQQMIDLINSLQYTVHLIPFDTSDKKDNSDSLLIKQLRKHVKNNVYYYHKSSNSSIPDMINYYNSLDLIIGGRYHSIILSLITCTPFIVLQGSQKLKNLMLDIPLLKDYSIEIKENIPVSSILNCVNTLTKNYNKVLSTLKMYNTTLKEQVNLFKDDFCLKLTKPQKRNISPIYMNPSEKNRLIKTVIHTVLSKLQKRISMNDIDSIRNGKPLHFFIPKLFTVNSLETLKKTLTEEILWIVTGDPSGPYYYGLFENLLSTKFNFIHQISWIIDDYYTNYATNLFDNKIAIINKNFQEIHRSGWQQVVDAIITTASNENYNESFIVDTYVDKTFHWNKNFYTGKGVIPYTTNWIGFIHHTFSEYNNTYNCKELFEDNLFLKSLECCKSLIVMSEYLKKDIVKELKKLNLLVPVHVLAHPTEFVDTDLLFTWDSFENNSNKQLVQIGSWLRNVFGIYKVVLPTDSVVYSKSILKNKNSDNYHLPPNFLDDLSHFFTKYSTGSSGSETICRNDLQNMHLKGLYAEIVRLEESVNVIEHLSNKDYDDLLSKNIVFIDLVDASACNTLIECIVRNTPIIVNHIPPVVEMLGKDYPLYYDNNSYYQVSEILQNNELIKQAHIYLQTLPKTKMDIQTFISKFLEIFSNCISLE